MKVQQKSRYRSPSPTFPRIELVDPQPAREDGQDPGHRLVLARRDRDVGVLLGRSHHLADAADGADLGHQVDLVAARGAELGLGNGLGRHEKLRAATVGVSPAKRRTGEAVNIAQLVAAHKPPALGGRFAPRWPN